MSNCIMVGKFEICLSKDNTVLVFVGNAMVCDWCCPFKNPYFALRYIDRLVNSILVKYGE